MHNHCYTYIEIRGVGNSFMVKPLEIRFAHLNQQKELIIFTPMKYVQIILMEILFTKE